MSTFFNQKEEVLSIELTPYGKQLLSLGKFAPAYYSFYDGDILYDGQHAQVSETQNNIVERIKNNTPRLRQNTKFTSSAQPIVSLEGADYVNQMFQSEASNAPFYRFLGSSSPWSDFFPAWDITLHPASSTELNNGVSYQANNTVPIMSSSIETEYHFSGSVITKSSTQKLVLDVQELNTLFKLNGNFDIEVFRTREDNRLERLKFINQNAASAQSLADQTTPYSLASSLEGSEQQITQEFPELDSSYVEFWLNILVDNEIEEITMPAGSTLYKGEVDRNIGSICADIDTQGGTDA